VLTVQEEERLWHGEATVRPRQAVDVQLDSEESVRVWVHESLSTQAMHLAHIPFAQGDGRYVLTFEWFSVRIRFSSVVLPAPRKPVITVTGVRSSVVRMLCPPRLKKMAHAYALPGWARPRCRHCRIPQLPPKQAVQVSTMAAPEDTCQ
jgi:hypothetical protein